tara:strand:+ start:555 stop:929 length:375 start_codon:yes stop_codon:yes gene_type:complete
MLENVYISIGELWDKYSILEIKKKNIKEIEKNEIIQEEIKLLNLKIGKYNLNDNLYIRLKAINEKLWQIEDRIREKEKKKEFDEEFIEIARSVYITNDERAKIKKSINIKFDSQLSEVKSYTDY